MANVVTTVFFSLWITVGHCKTHCYFNFIIMYTYTYLYS